MHVGLRMKHVHVVRLLYLAGLVLHHSSAVSDPRYVGCYKDAATRALPHHIGDPGDIEPCIRSCIEHGYAYAGLQHYQECWCGGDTYSQHGEQPGECTTQCINNRTQMCGGTPFRLSVYRAVCPAGLWKQSPACSAQCGHCLVNMCDLTTGQCVQCEEGWKPLLCTGCANGYFGPDCTSRCHCLDGVACNLSNGRCPDEKCAAGWMGPTCSTECTRGYFGLGCSSKCRCLDGASCNIIDGLCPDDNCAAGWQGIDCSTECTSGYFGLGCSFNCNCLDGVACSPVHGQCPDDKCAAGWQGANCSTAVMMSAPASIPAGAIGGAAAGILCLIILVVILVIFLRKRKKKLMDDDMASTGSIDGSAKGGVALPVNVGVYNNIAITKPIKLEDLYHVIQQELAKEKPFEDEFQKLPKNKQAEWTAGDRAGQQHKENNRFKNILPYDHSRVLLSQVSDDPLSDYINASHIKGFSSNESFIAAQGPTPKTLTAFWRMIWEQKVGLVVMVTNLKEGKTNKCTQYWPVKGHRKYGETDVKLVSTQVWPDFTLRRMTLTKEEESRHVIQFHFTGWPDHGVPRHATALLNFRHKVRREMQTKDNLGPVVVHCSAGIGRTGAYLAIDYLLQQADAKQEIDVLTCVNLMRENRINMVQTREQYAFVYTAVLEALFVGVTLIPCFEFPDVYSRMLNPDPYSSTSKLEQQYKLLESQKAESPQKPSGNKRPQSRAGSSGAEALDAVFVDGRKESNKFIAAQTPQAERVEEFWQIAYECHCSCIVMLQMEDTGQEDCNTYWPPEDASNTHGDIAVSLESCTEEGDNLVVRTLALLHAKKEPRQIQQVHLTGWTLDGSSDVIPAGELFNIREIVTRCQNKASMQGPVFVHCRDGVSCTGLYLAASNLCDMISVEQELDVFQVVQALRSSKPDFITSQAQYEYLYKVAQQYMESFSEYANFR